MNSTRDIDRFGERRVRRFQGVDPGNAGRIQRTCRLVADL
jgi:hypothetical protein